MTRLIRSGGNPSRKWRAIAMAGIVLILATTLWAVWFLHVVQVRVDLNNIAYDIVGFYTDTGHLPLTVAELQVTGRPPRFSDGGVANTNRKPDLDFHARDPWGTPYTYRVDSVRSLLIVECHSRWVPRHSPPGGMLFVPGNLHPASADD